MVPKTEMAAKQILRTCCLIIFRGCQNCLDLGSGLNLDLLFFGQSSPLNCMFLDVAA